MARGYTVATAALALRVPAKWLDNALSHNQVTGVLQARQGVPRRLSVDGLLIIGLALWLTIDFAIPLPTAIAVAEKLVSTQGEYNSDHGVKIKVDLEGFRRELLTRLDHAVEVAPLPRRGRPPKNRTGRLE